jgi:hypothetical protein
VEKQSSSSLVLVLQNIQIQHSCLICIICWLAASHGVLWLPTASVLTQICWQRVPSVWPSAAAEVCHDLSADRQRWATSLSHIARSLLRPIRRVYNGFWVWQHLMECYDWQQHPFWIRFADKGCQVLANCRSWRLKYYACHDWLSSRWVRPAACQCHTLQGPSSEPWTKWRV